MSPVSSVPKSYLADSHRLVILGTEYTGNAERNRLADPSLKDSFVPINRQSSQAELLFRSAPKGREYMLVGASFMGALFVNLRNLCNLWSASILGHPQGVHPTGTTITGIV